MMNNKIPEQIEGGFSDNVSEVEFETVAEAAFHFDKVRKRLFDINSWYFFAEKTGAEFSLCDNNGKVIFKQPIVNNYIKIKLPLLYNPTGNTFDWVRIELIEEEQFADGELVYMKLRPSEDPDKKDGKISHFFRDNATSNVLIKRDGNKTTAEVHGRNEIPNTEHLTLLEKARNIAVSVNAIILGSKFEWKTLTEALIKNDEK
ncbi:hypothetical protein [Kaistella jeonii]|uniref:hypothetical protein n=1 Tax=Kaistella jeonii TaxID=266749 RepID=UPI00068B226A|nr:hypothetical protein [Kaistella jeonii]SFB72590.1 hypothetical protein SAMN05421876_101389 [Kaistella jeonii]VEI94979.1 Uncharacterised protein [Kaistella jeonii]